MEPRSSQEILSHYFHLRASRAVSEGHFSFFSFHLHFHVHLFSRSAYKLYYPFKDEAQTALFKDPVRTAL